MTMYERTQDPRWNVVWTAERVEVLKNLWADGVACTTIANLIGGTTKNSVIGKARRLGLDSHADSFRVRRLNGLTAPKRVPQPRKPKAPRTIVAPEPELPAFATEIRTESSCDIMGLNSQNCHWPVGDPGSEAFFFCGQPSEPGRPYCMGHRRVAYLPRKPRNTDPLRLSPKRLAVPA